MFQKDRSGPEGASLAKLRKYLRSGIFGNTSVMTVSMGLRLFLQTFSFIIVAGTMGARQFGAFVSVAALCSILSAFAGWGADQLVVRRVARGSAELPRAMATGFVFMSISCPLLFIVALVLVPLVVDSSIPWMLVLLVAVSDIFCARLNSFTAACYQAVDRVFGSAGVGLSLAVLRIFAACLWVSIGISHDAMSWAHYYVAASLLGAGLSVWRQWRDLGAPVWKVDWAEWRDGFHFSLQLATFVAFGNFDKPLVAALSNLATAGLYAAAFRIAAAAMTPVRALLYSTYPNFFRAGVAGPRHSFRLAIRLLPAGIGLGALGSIIIMAMAPLAPHLLGNSYVGTQTALLILAPLPIFYVIYTLGADVLVSSGHTSMRTLIQLAMPAVNILLCWIIVPRYGAIGAAAASVASHALLAAITWLIVGIVVFSRNDRVAPVAGPVATQASEKGSSPL